MLGGRDVELAERRLLIERRDVFEVPAGAERAAGAVEHRDRRLVVGVEFEEGGGEIVRALGVHRVARLGTIVDHRPHRAAFLDPHRHCRSSGCWTAL